MRTLKLKEKPKDVLERINSDDAVLADNGHTWETFNRWCMGLDEDEKAGRFIKLLRKSLNGPDWEADFDNKDQVKYVPWFVGGSSGFRFSDCGGWRARSYVGSRLCFKEGRLAVHAGTKFTKWFKQAIIVK